MQPAPTAHGPVLPTSAGARSPTPLVSAGAVAVVHDYLTQRGGAERVVLSMLEAFPHARLHTSVFDQRGTFPEFAGREIATSRLDHLSVLRRHHRLGLPLYAAAFSRMRVDADVVLCSSSGWAHGVQTDARKVVYCYAPARWLYQQDRYLGHRSRALRLATAGLLPPLRRWDKRAAASADRYLTSSSAVQAAIRHEYGIDAEVVPPPHRMDVGGRQIPVEWVQPGALLLVARLLPYKNVDAVVSAMSLRSDEQLVVVGDGPERARLERLAPPNVRFLGTVREECLRWLYANCRAVVAASYEDYGLTPIEAAAFGRPTVALRAGGYLDTIVEGTTGLFFDTPEPSTVARALDDLDATPFDSSVIADHAERYTEPAFCRRLQEIVAEELLA